MNALSETAAEAVISQPAMRPAGRALHPLLIMMGLLVLATALTHLVPSGRYARADDKVVAGSYRPLDKVAGLPALIAPSVPTTKDTPARAGGVVSFFAAIPSGLQQAAGMTFMVLCVGGMFGVLRATGALDAGVDRLLHVTSGNVYVLTAGLMIVIGCGSSFFGFISEYVAILPLVLLVGQRLGLPNLFGLAVVGVAAKVGYAASVANPVSLAVAQPLAGVPVFSGTGARMAIFLVMMTLSIGYVLLYLRRLPKSETAVVQESQPLSGRHLLVLFALLSGGVVLLFGSREWSWHNTELAAFFIALSFVVAIAGKLAPTATAEAYLEGMKTTLLAAVLIGLAGAAAIIMQSSQILDSIVAALTSLVNGHPPAIVAGALMTTEMVLDLAVPSLAAKAAISLPILTPIAQLSGVSGQATVTAMLLGSGLNHLVSPTSSVLLAFLSTSRVGYGEWIRFIAPLWALLGVVAFAALWLMTLFQM